MQLIYAYLDIQSRKIKQEINFNSQYIVKYDEEKSNINIQENKDYHKITGFYGDNIDNIDLIVGDNGYGKTTLLDIIGIKSRDLFPKFSSDDDSWILLFQSELNQQKVFYIEGYAGADGKTYLLTINDKNTYVSHIGNLYTLEFGFDNFGDNSIIFYGDNLLKKDKTKIYYMRHSQNDLSDIIKSVGTRRGLEGRGIKREYLTYNYKSIFKFLLNGSYDEKIHNKEKKLSISIKPLTNNHREALEKLCSNYFVKDDYRLRELFAYDFKKYNVRDAFILNLLITIFANVYYRFSKTRSYIHSELYMKESEIEREVVGCFYDYVPTDDVSIRIYIMRRSISRMLRLISSLIPNVKYDFQYIEKIIAFFENANEDIISIISYRNCELKITDMEKYSYVEDYLRYFWNGKMTNSSFEDRLDLGIECYIEGFSSGEGALINLFSSLSAQFDDKNAEKAILIFDEPDCTLHPEWARIFIKNICDELSKYSNYRFSIIMTTHSPLPVSDFFKENIHLIGNNKKTNINSFCGNIGEIMIDNFFLERPFGEFAFNKIEFYMKKLEMDYLTEEEQEEIQYVISSIGDIIIKKSLQYQYTSWLDKHLGNKEQQILRKKLQIKVLQDELKELEENNND